MTLIDATYFNANMIQLGVKENFAPKDAVLDTLIAEASEWVQNYLKRRIESGEVVELIRGNDRNRLTLDEYPVTAVASAYYEDDAGYSGAVDLTGVRTLAEGILEFKKPWALDMTNFGGTAGPWRSHRLYTITYTAGYVSIPAVIKRATALKVVDLFTPQYQGARDQRSIDFASKGEEMIVDLLEPYRRQRIG